MLVARLLGDVGAILLGLMMADLAQDALSNGGLAHPLRSVNVFNLLTVSAWLTIFADIGLYDRHRLVNAADEFKLVLHGVAIGSVVAVFAAFLLRIPTQRSWVLVIWFSCTVTVLVTRGTYRHMIQAMHRSGILVSRMLIVGAGREGRELCRAIRRSRNLGFKVLGFLDDQQPPGPVEQGLPDVLGDVASVRAQVIEHSANAVLVAGGSNGGATAERIYRELERLPVDLHLSTGVVGVAASRVAVQRFDGAPVLAVRRIELTRFQQAVKRGFDLVVTVATLAVLWPLLLACALAVRLSGPGPVLFTQLRVGRDGKTFRLHKLRSMVPDAEHRLVSLSQHNEIGGPYFKMTNDPRVTAVGRVLRAWSLDELPQLFDVLRGHMSLVGPRPQEPHQVEVADRIDPRAAGRLQVKPGLSGLWQVSGRHKLSSSDRVRYDLFYVDNWSLSMDLFILLRTIPAVLRRSGV